MRAILKKIANFSPACKNMGLFLLDTFIDYRKVVIGYMVRLPAYCRNTTDTKVLARPGTLGFGGGAFNPGAVVADNQIILLAKATRLPWFKAQGKKRNLFLKGNPLIFVLDPMTLTENRKEIVNDFVGFPEEYPWAIEDMRLFKFRDTIFINHSLVEFGKDDTWFGQGSVSASLSVLNYKEKSITFHQVPQLDFAKQKIEKNWAYLEHNERLYLFYSLNPYRVLVEDGGCFKTVIHRDLGQRLKDVGGFGTMVSQSTNPVHFDKDHYLMVVHQIENRQFGRCYHHWALLIAKDTLMPVKITATPIFSGLGARGRMPGIRYISSVLIVNDEVLFFGGEGDVFVTVIKRSVSEIIDKMVWLEER